MAKAGAEPTEAMADTRSSRRRQRPPGLDERERRSFEEEDGLRRRVNTGETGLPR